MSSIVRPSMRGALTLMWTARAIGPSAASIRHWIARYRNTSRGSGSPAHTSAAARNANTTPDAVNACTPYASARCIGVIGTSISYVWWGDVPTGVGDAAEADGAGVSPTPDPLAHVPVLFALDFALGLLFDDLPRVLVVLGVAL